MSGLRTRSQHREAGSSVHDLFPIPLGLPVILSTTDVSGASSASSSASTSISSSGGSSLLDSHGSDSTFDDVDPATTFVDLSNTLDARLRVAAILEECPLCASCALARVGHLFQQAARHPPSWLCNCRCCASIVHTDQCAICMAQNASTPRQPGGLAPALDAGISTLRDTTERGVSPMSDGLPSPPPPIMEEDDYVAAPAPAAPATPAAPLPAGANESGHIAAPGLEPGTSNSANQQREPDSVSVTNGISKVKTLIDYQRQPSFLTRLFQEINLLRNEFNVHMGSLQLAQTRSLSSDDEERRVLIDTNLGLSKSIDVLNSRLTNVIESLHATTVDETSPVDQEKQITKIENKSGCKDVVDKHPIENVLLCDTVRPRFSIKEPDNFDAGAEADLNSWIRQVDHFTKLVGLQADAKAEYIATLLRAAPFDAFNTLDAESQIDPTKIYDMLRQKFGSAGRHTLLYSKLFNLKKEKSQSVQDYYKKVLHYLSLLNITDTPSKIQHFVKGFPDEIRNTLEISRLDSIESCFDLASLLHEKYDKESERQKSRSLEDSMRAIDDMVKKVELLAQKHSPVNGINSHESHMEVNEISQQFVCWTCGALGHRYRDCPNMGNPTYPNMGNPTYPNMGRGRGQFDQSDFNNHNMMGFARPNRFQQFPGPRVEFQSRTPQNPSFGRGRGQSPFRPFQQQRPQFSAPEYHLNL